MSEWLRRKVREWRWRYGEDWWSIMGVPALILLVVGIAAGGTYAVASLMVGIAGGLLIVQHDSRRVVQRMQSATEDDRETACRMLDESVSGVAFVLTILFSPMAWILVRRLAGSSSDFATGEIVEVWIFSVLATFAASRPRFNARRGTRKAAAVAAALVALHVAFATPR